MNQHRLFVILGIIVSLAGVQAQTCDPKSLSTFVSDITVTKGQIRLARDAKGKFAPRELIHPELLKACLPNQELDQPAVLDKLTRDLDAALASRKLFYWYDPTLSDDQKSKLKLPDALTRPSVKWIDYWAAYREFAGPLRAARTWSFFLDNLHSDLGALVLHKEKTDLTNSVITFNVVAVGGHWSDKLPQPWPEGLHVDRETIADYLDDLDDGLWRKDRIQAWISDYFTQRGWSPTISVTPPDAPPLAIRLGRSLPIRQVTFVPLLSPEDRERALYVLLPEQRFKEAANRPVCQHTTGIKFITLDLSTAPGPCSDDPKYVAPEPFPDTPFNQTAFSSQQPLIAALGFTSSNSPLSDGTGIDLRVDRTVPKSQAALAKDHAAVPQGKMTPSTTGPGGAVPAPTGLSQPAPKLPDLDHPCSAETKDTGSCPQPLAPREQRGFIGAGFQYLAGQGVRPLAAVEYQRLFGPGSVSLETGSANQFFVISGAIAFDFIGFHRFRHRVSFNAKGGTDTINNRLLLGQELRERRNGGQARIDVEARRNDLGHSVDLYVEGGQQLVDLTNPKLTSGSQTVLSDTFTSGAFGAVYTISGLSRPRPYWMRLEPRIQGASAQNGRFYNIGASGTYHQDSLGAFSFEVKVHFADASRNVPIYETPSFGGVNVMRGFRADDILARRFWSTQPELWFGVPNTFGKEGKIASFLSRNVRLATFFDAGGVYHTAAGDPSGLRGGPGAGVRVDFHQATVRLDWAYGLGQAATASCCGKVYFSVSRPLF